MVVIVFFRCSFFEHFQFGISIRVLSGLCSFSIFFLLFYSTSSAYPRNCGESQIIAGTPNPGLVPCAHSGQRGVIIAGTQCISRTFCICSRNFDQILRKTVGIALSCSFMLFQSVAAKNYVNPSIPKDKKFE